MIGNTYLQLKLLKKKIPFKALHPYKDTRKVKYFQKLSNKKNYFTFKFKSNSITNFSNSFRGQISLKDTIFLVKKVLMHIHFLSGTNLFIFLFSQILQYIEWAAQQRFCVLAQPICREQEESQPNFTFHYTLSKITVDFIQ